MATIRKPYLSTAAAPIRRQDRPGHASNGLADEEGLDRWRDSKHLTDRERDEIDLRGKVILRRCRERVGALEQQEKGESGLFRFSTRIRVEVSASELTKARQKAIAPPAVSTLYTFLPSLAPADTSSTLPSSLITAHRSSVLWTLNDLMARLVSTMANLQEERHKRREERSRTLGGQASREAAKLGSSSAHNPTTSSSKPLFPLPAPTRPSNPSSTAAIPSDEPPIEDQLTAAQMQQFASENNALLEHMESKLSSVLAAEKSLLEISAMQTELVRHLASQTEITERLYEEAVGSVAEVGKANEQLKQARKRGEEGRLFLLVFLIGASMALLFLDWYS